MRSIRQALLLRNREELHRRGGGERIAEAAGVLPAETLLEELVAALLRYFGEELVLRVERRSRECREAGERLVNGRAGLRADLVHQSSRDIQLLVQTRQRLRLDQLHLVGEIDRERVIRQRVLREREDDAVGRVRR